MLFALAQWDDEHGRFVAQGSSTIDTTALLETLAILEARVTALEAAVPSANSRIWACPPTVAVRKAVYQSGDGTLDLALASDPDRMPAKGFVSEKPTPTTCVLRDSGELEGFVGLTPDVPYYVSPTSEGDITQDKPDPINNEIPQQVCTPKTDQVIDIEISVPPPVFP